MNNNCENNSVKYSTVDAEYDCYPGLDQSDEEEAYPLAQSYEIQMDQGMGFIQRSNTAQKLDKMNLARKRAAQIKNVKLQDQVAAPISQDASSLFIRKSVISAPRPKSVYPPGQSLTELLVKTPKQLLNKYLQYARFDGTGQLPALTKKIRIFLTMLPEKQRNYPMSFCVLGSAKIQEFIGLICYKTSVEYPDVELVSIRNYGLYITEEDGEVDADFPPLDLNEPCSKFCFSHLALVKRNVDDVRPDARTMSLSSEVEAIQEALLEEQEADAKIQAEAQKFMRKYIRQMEAPIYKSYPLQLLRSNVFKTDIQLGISAEKLELDPVQQQNSKFWSHQKAISHNMDSVVWSETVDEPSHERTIVKIVYSPSPLSNDGAAYYQQESSSPPIHSSRSQHHNPTEPAPSSVFRSYKFLTDPETAQEISDKVRNIIEVRSSQPRRDYQSRRSEGTGILCITPLEREVLDAIEKKKKPFKKLFN